MKAASSSVSLELLKLLSKYKPQGISKELPNGVLTGLVEKHLQNKASKWVELLFNLDLGPGCIKMDVPKKIMERQGEASPEFKQLRDCLLDQIWANIPGKTAEAWLSKPELIWFILDKVLGSEHREVKQVLLTVPLVTGTIDECIARGNFNKVSRHFNEQNFASFIRLTPKEVMHEVIAVNLGYRISPQAARRARSLLKLGPIYLNHLTSVCEHNWPVLGQFKQLVDIDSVFVLQKKGFVPCFMRSKNSLVLLSDNKKLPPDSWILGKPRADGRIPPPSFILQRVK